MAMAKRKLATADLERHLEEQLELLTLSCDSYDRGTTQKRSELRQ
jgi:hypothetical protein